MHGGDLYDPSKRLSPHRHAWLRRTVRSVLRARRRRRRELQQYGRPRSRIYGVSRDVSIVPLGIERPRNDRGRIARRLRTSGRRLRLVTIGRLIARKQTLQLVEPWRAAASRTPTWS